MKIEVINEDVYADGKNVAKIIEENKYMERLIKNYDVTFQKLFNKINNNEKITREDLEQL